MTEIITLLITIVGMSSVNGGGKSVNMLQFTGHAESEYFVGEVLPGGVDTQMRENGKGGLSARYILEGTDSTGAKCKIFIENNGKDGEEYTKPTIVTDSKALSFLNTCPLKGKLDMSNGKLTIRIYRCDDELAAATIGTNSNPAKQETEATMNSGAAKSK
jgi:hypothetical protein